MYRFHSFSYPPRYIHSRFTKFLQNNFPNGSIIPLIESKCYFEMIRSNLLNRPTPTELQMAARIARATDQHSIEKSDPTSAVSSKQKQKSKWDSNLIIHYKHEKRFETLKKDIHQLWNEMFHDTPVTNTKLIIGHKNNSSATQELVQRRPHHMPKLIPPNQLKQTTSLDADTVH